MLMTSSIFHGAGRESLIIFSLKFVSESFVGRLGYKVPGLYSEVFVDLHFLEGWWDTFLYVELSG